MEIEIIKFFQNMASSLLDSFFWVVTKLGEETVFLIILTCIYLCYDKFFAVKYMFYYLISVGVNTVVKAVVERPRPYNVSNEVKNRLPASNYSFPSGHSQGYFVQASTGMNEINSKCNKTKFKILLLLGFIFVGLLVMISRMYWGQHYLSDVIMGMIFGIAIPFVLEYIFSLFPKSFKRKFNTDRVFLAIGVLAGFVAIVLFVLEFGLSFYSSKLYKFTAIILAMSFGYFIDCKYIKFNPKQGWIWGIFKFIITIVVLVGMYYIMVMSISLRGYLYFVVYFILGLIACVGLPAVFKVLSIKNNKK